MQCKKCGHDTRRPVFERVEKFDPPAPQDLLKPVEAAPAYARWACEKCGRYHFRDGSLYSNPYT